MTRPALDPVTLRWCAERAKYCSGEAFRIAEELPPTPENVRPKMHARGRGIAYRILAQQFNVEADRIEQEKRDDETES